MSIMIRTNIMRRLLVLHLCQHSANHHRRRRRIQQTIPMPLANPLHTMPPPSNVLHLPRLEVGRLLPLRAAH